MATYIITTSPNRSSVPNYFFGIADALHKRGNTVVVITDKNKPEMLPPNEDGIYYYSWYGRRPTSFKDFRFFLTICKRHRPDCVIGNFGAQNIVLLAGMLLRIKYRVAYWHMVWEQLQDTATGQRIKHSLQVWRKKWMLKLLATHVFTNSESSKKDLVDHFDLDASSIEVFHLLIPDPMVGITPVVVKENAIAFAGRLNKLKGQELLLNAVPGLNKHIEGLKVYIIGGGEEEARLKTLCTTLKISDVVTFTGDIAPAAVYQLMNRSKVHISCSSYEAYGLVNVEALGAGTPIVAPKVGGIQEILKDGVNGYFFDAAKENDLADKIFMVMQGDEQKLARDARQSFLDSFAIANIDKQMAIYERLFGK